MGTDFSHQFLDCLFCGTAHQFHSAILQIAHESRDGEVPGQFFHRPPKSDTLDSPFKQHTPGHLPIHIEVLRQYSNEIAQYIAEIVCNATLCTTPAMSKPMKPRQIVNAFALITISVSLAAFTFDRGAHVLGCAAAPPPESDVTITDESALIVWNPETQTEHFIRKASFVSDAADFGFLVPTPTVPSLHEGGKRSFARLANLTKPRIIRQPVESEEFRFFRPGTGPLDWLLPHQPTVSALPDAPMVEVLNQQEVSGYDASILRASDPDALRTWLNEHGYFARPELTQWLEKYTTEGWIITAFKMAKSSKGSGRMIYAGPVRMTFQTDRPFYPYREPADMQTQSDQNDPVSDRLLRIFFISDGKYAAHIGETTRQPAKTVWFNEVDARSRRTINQDHRLAGDSSLLTDTTRWLTEFEDTSSPRQGTDELYFRISEDQSAVERPPTIQQYTVRKYSPDLSQWPFWLGGFAIVGLFFVRRMTRSTETSD